MVGFSALLLFVRRYGFCLSGVEIGVFEVWCGPPVEGQRPFPFGLAQGQEDGCLYGHDLYMQPALD